MLNEIILDIIGLVNVSIVHYGVLIHALSEYTWSHINFFFIKVS